MPGWYPDPWRVAPWRWWDGTGWRAETLGGPPAAPPPFAGAPTDRALSRARELRWGPRARVGLVVWAVIQSITVVTFGLVAHALFHDFLAVLRASSRTGSHPFRPKRLPIESWQIAAVDLGTLFADVAGVAFLIWQYNAAEVSRSLGYPLRHSPALGIVWWFVPIVSLWMPYQALVDLLPAGHPARGRALAAWLLYIAAGAAFVIGILACFLGPLVAGIPVVAVAAGMFLSASALGCSLVAAVESEHAAALSGQAGSLSGLAER